jgi:acyl-CoA synthetase (AMP-forming)/AMP-acid ligase II
MTENAIVWSYANAWEPIARLQPGQPAVLQGERALLWGAFDAQADALAAHLIAAGLRQNSKVGVYLYNCAEYLVANYAGFKAGLAPFNVNYRYTADELLYLFDNADAEAIVFHASFAERVDEIRARLPQVKCWIAVEELGFSAPSWAENYASVVSSVPPTRPTMPPWGRSNDDLLILYTGGTTGLPKGVMWRQEDQIGVTGFGGSPLLGVPPLARPEAAAERIAHFPRRIGLVACPLMHGTGLFSALMTLLAGGAVLLLPGRHFDAEQLWDEVARHRATSIAIVGLPFAQPLLEALERKPGRWDLTCVTSIGSSGAMWSQENKHALLRFIPQAMLTDAFSSSEAVGIGLSVSTAAGESQTAAFIAGPECAVFTEDHKRVAPGSGERGLVAVGGFLPLGYYGDDEKTKRTFAVIEGKRWSIPGDWATVEADGSLRLLGRGSQCINTGGEKVFPEEVEEALKRHPAVRDAAVIGAPDARFGERVCAVVELQPDARDPSLSDLAAHVRAHLADYKTPRALVVVDSLRRAPNGKLDYKAVKARALEMLG